MDGQSVYPSALYEWYLARLRRDALRRTQQRMTPMTLVGSDRSMIQNLVLQTRNNYSQRSDDILAHLTRCRERSAGNNFLPKLFNVQRDLSSLAQTQDLVASKMLAALNRSAGTDDGTVPDIDIANLTDDLIAELEQARQREKLIADCTVDILCCLDEKRRLLELNVEFEVLLNLQKLSLLTTPLETLIIPADQPDFLRYIDDSRDCQLDREPIECRMQKRDGGIIDTEWLIEWSETSRCYFCLGKNITERRQNERLKEEIAAMIGHDLRVPATGVTLVLENLGAGIYGELSEQAQAKVAVAHENVSNMLQLIDQLLDAEKLDAGEMPRTIATVVLSDVYARCLNMVQQMAEKKHVALLFPETSNLAVSADFDHAVRILFNLVSNAIKFAPEQSQVTITEQEKAANGADFVFISVSDRGPGIPAQLQPSVFERYKSGTNKGDNTIPGKGLGLYIARRLTQLQGGTIGFDNGADGGTTFWFSLPQLTSSMR